MDSEVTSGIVRFGAMLRDWRSSPIVRRSSLAGGDFGAGTDRWLGCGAARAGADRAVSASGFSGALTREGIGRLNLGGLAEFSEAGALAASSAVAASADLAAASEAVEPFASSVAERAAVAEFLGLTRHSDPTPAGARRRRQDAAQLQGANAPVINQMLHPFQPQ